MDVDVMDIDATHDRDVKMAGGDSEDQQVQQLEHLAQDTIHNHSEHQVADDDEEEDENGENDGDDEDDEETWWDPDMDSLESDNSDMGPEDEKGLVMIMMIMDMAPHDSLLSLWVV